MPTKEFAFSFVSRIPDELSEGVVYINIPCNVAIHLCACGCREKVVMPIDRQGWELRYNGDSVSFSPSIGNWSFKCKSHYFIRENKVVWAYPEAPCIPKKDVKRESLWSRLFNKKGN